VTVQVHGLPEPEQLDLTSRVKNALTRLLHAPYRDLFGDLVCALLSGLAADSACDCGQVPAVQGHGSFERAQLDLARRCTSLRDSGLPADVLVGKLKKDISFALRRGTISQVTTALDAAQRAVEDESALNEAGWDR
jgi:hypothetical protein